MRILVFEFITGGGMSQESLPESLAKEGLLMLETLLDELADLEFVELTVLLDFRIDLPNLPIKIKIIRVARNQSVYELLPRLIEASDWVWPIAPEMDSELQTLSELVEAKNKYLLNSSSEAVTICGDKLLSYQLLKNKGIDIVETHALNDGFPKFPGKWVVKPKDGVGSINTFFIKKKVSFEKLKYQLECQSDYIFQPYIDGESLSLSCLFKDGAGWLLCCNRQKVSIEKGKFKLISCDVNIAKESQVSYQGLINQVANEVPGLWGYVGIDLIQPKHGKPSLLEINPRLTTSYAGIRQAIGFNVAKAVVEMIENDPQIRLTKNKMIEIAV